ncbi:MAG TPA: hypothetical protein VFW98_05410 [Gemmatimonadaceae bacterium]|nr:hypothetical protein [Gemmatimonadaceae bacterium]
MRHASLHVSLVLTSLLVLAGSVELPQRALAQRDTTQADTADRPPPDVCYGFTFGRWTPPLDPRATGIAADSASSTPRTPTTPPNGGMGNAASDSTALMLFPDWWRVGVGIHLRHPPGAHDTVTGRAYAYVADGSTSPTTKVRVWRIPCGNGAQPHSP